MGLSFSILSGLLQMGPVVTGEMERRAHSDGWTAGPSFWSVDDWTDDFDFGGGS